MGDVAIVPMEKKRDWRGQRSDTYTDNSIKEADVITCVLTSNAVCLARSAATSNPITVQVQKKVVPVSLGPDVQICAGAKITLDVVRHTFRIYGRMGQRVPAWVRRNQEPIPFGLRTRAEAFLPILLLFMNFRLRTPFCLKTLQSVTRVSCNYNPLLRLKHTCGTRLLFHHP